MASNIDWAEVGKAARKAYPAWHHVGDALPRTTADALRRGKMRDCKDIEVQTRNTHWVNGVRHCSIYARKKDS